MLTHQSETRRKSSLGEIALLFRAFDRDRRGHITAEDLRHVMSSVNESVTDKELDAMMLAADVDGDGLISYEEFAAILSPECVAEEQE
ncbi:hypothetical protein V5799_026545 [Amblyomma americanum]|uniref:EF-hand domain-containing protein n=1 Tax=Amblyomma americanum TaxID=6943 RepID=A0AAQ4DI99_AMBAM